MAFAILERISSLEPPSETTAPRYAKLCYGTQLLPFHLNLRLDSIGAVCHQFGLLSTDLIIYLKKFSRDFLVPALPQLEHLCHCQTADW